nr:hypothetical protein CFP56_33411 [Quercus suber]
MLFARPPMTFFTDSAESRQPQSWEVNALASSSAINTRAARSLQLMVWRRTRRIVCARTTYDDRRNTSGRIASEQVEAGRLISGVSAENCLRLGWKNTFMLTLCWDLLCYRLPSPFCSHSMYR